MRQAFILLLLFLTGCGGSVGMNPSFPLLPGDAASTLSRLKHEPMVLERPLVVLAGYQDPGYGAMSVARRIRRVVANPEMVISISFFTCKDFDACRQRAIEEVEAAFPSSDPRLTTEVDVIGISMGGIVARHSARTQNNRAGLKQLNIATLFSIGTPHHGAKLAWLPTWDNKQKSMRPESEFIAALNRDASSYDFTIVAYGRAGDEIVGLRNAVPPKGDVWWVPNLPGQSPHLTSASDPRIIADIVQRVGGGRPFTRGEPAPLP